VQGQVADGQGDQASRAAQPAVAGRGGRQVGKQVPEPGGGHAQPAAFGADAEQDLGDGQADQLSVAELGSSARTGSRADQLVDGDVQCDDEGVEVGVHEASPEVDVASARPMLGALASLVTLARIRKQSSSVLNR
jgi:hypothetical protein